MANTNIKYLKENNLYEAHQHFMQIVEGYPFEMEEAGEDDPNAMGGAPGADPMGGDDLDSDPITTDKKAHQQTPQQGWAVGGRNASNTI